MSSTGIGVMHAENRGGRWATLRMGSAHWIEKVTSHSTMDGGESIDTWDRQQYPASALCFVGFSGWVAASVFLALAKPSWNTALGNDHTRGICTSTYTMNRPMTYDGPEAVACTTVSLRCFAPLLARGPRR